MSNLDSALGYAARGWRVFPCRPDSKVPATPHGLADATVDLDQIRRWWQHCTAYNIAVACGPGSIDVLDVDVHESGDGYAALRTVRAAGLAEGAQAIVSTPSGGCHLWFRGTVQRSGRVREHHIDFRSNGGYVLVPPSVIEDRAYEYRARNPHARGVADWAAIKSLLSPPRAPAPGRSGDGDPAHLAAWMAAREEGERNSALYWAACRAAEAGADVEPLVDAAIEAGLPEREARATVASAMRSARRLQ